MSHSSPHRSRVYTSLALVTLFRFVIISSHSVIAQDSDPDDVLAGHSYHGEAFNEGPRQFAYRIEGTGPVSFEVSSTVPAVRQYIEQGIGQLHGFWYYESERSFRHAAMLDPQSAISYWGMALANTNNKERAKKFLAEATRLKEQASPKEIALIDALEGYLLSDEDETARARHYTAALEQIVEQFPDDLECRALLGYAYYEHRGTLKKSYEEVNDYLGTILDREPLHPVHHYRIHLWDAKDAKLALESSALCGASSPAIAHMWHMPGHIYSRLKRYHDAVWQQEASARVDHAQMMRDGVMPDQIHNFAHNNEWLIRNLIFIGRHRDAANLAMNMIQLPQHPKFNTLSQRRSAWYGRERLFDVLRQFELWDAMIQACDSPLLEPTDDLAQQLKRLRYCGMAHASLGHVADAESIVGELTARRQALSAEASQEVPGEVVADEGDTSGESDSDNDKADEDKAEGDDESEKREEAAEADKSKEPDAQAKREARRKKREQDRKRKSIDAAIAAVQEHLALYQGDLESAWEHHQKVTESRDELLKARLLSLRGEHDQAIKEVGEVVRTHKGEVLPLATQLEIYWRANAKDKAVECMQQLRDLSGSVQFGSPVFDRVTNIAIQMGLPSDWRLPYQHPTDFGARPSLDELGPFRWEPVKAPEWSLADATGKTISLGDYSGRPVVVVFFLGYGCLHCAQQLQALAPVTERFAQAGISLIAISSDNAEGLRKSVENYGSEFPFPLVSNEPLDVFRQYRAYDDFEQQPLHGTYLIDAEGRIRWQDISYEPFMDAEFLLNESQRLLGSDRRYHELARAMMSPSAQAVAHVVRKPIVDATHEPSSAAPLSIAGISGRVLLLSREYPDEAVTQFLRASEQSEGPVVVVQLGDPTTDARQFLNERLFTAWNKDPQRELRFMRLDLDSDELDDDRQELLAATETASAVWISADRIDKATLLLEDQLVSGLLGVLQRQGTVALESHLVDGIGERLLPGLLPMVAGSFECNAAGGEPPAPALSADSLSFEQRLSLLPDRVGLRLEGTAGVLVDGRRLRVLGDGQVSLHFAATPYFAPRTRQLEGRRRQADLLALRRYAAARLASGFPHTGSELPVLENGSLMIVGGGGMPRGALRRFVELAGGEEASIVVIPISMPDPLPEQDGIVEQFRRLGAKRVTVLRGRTPAEVDDPESLQSLRDATGIWFGGGRQWRFVDAYEGTEAERLIREVLDRGGVIGGSSAGASIQAEYLVRGNPLGPEEIIAEGYEQGMKFLPGVAIDQHFTQRDRHSDLQQLVLRYPGLLGIGIDESTMIVVRGTTAEVRGEHHVYFYDPAEVNPGGSPVKLKDGAWYDLVRRRPLGGAAQSP